MVAGCDTAVPLSFGHLHGKPSHMSRPELWDQRVPDLSKGICVDPVLVSIKAKPQQGYGTAYSEDRPSRLKHFEANDEG